MASPDLELQGAIYARLTTYAPLTALISQRVYDRPPATWPGDHVTIGEAQALRADAECVDGQDIYLTMHAWSQYTGGFRDVKRIADAVVTGLHEQSLTLSTNRLVSMSHRQTRVFRDADGATSHAVIEFVASTERL
jgi:hypothetical protein